MLTKLRVRDLALVAEAEVSLGPGLNLLTGETGSGKSLIVDALALSLGARASVEQVRFGTKSAVVEAVFDVSGLPVVAAAAAQLGFEGVGELTLRREVGGRGSARVNGRQAAPGQLRELGRLLVGVHGQHEHQALLDEQAQTLALDAHAGALELRARVAVGHAEWVAARRRLEDLERLRARGLREQDHLRFQLEELRGAALRAGEDEELAAERGAARHAVRLGELSAEALESLRADDGAAAAAGRIRQAAGLDPRLESLAGRLEGLSDELADAAGELRHYAETIDSDPARLEALESRLAQLDAIKRKYGGSIDAAIDERDQLALQLEQVDDLDSAVAAAEGEVGAARKALEDVAAELTAVRTAAAAGLAAAVQAELQGLLLAGATFEISLRGLDDITSDGAQAAEMLFCANPGEPLLPLARVASGGELSRVMLAIKSAGAESDRLPVLVFDEVDAGIGGEAALQVGLRLKALGRRRQVLVVTHLAQVACFADHHLLVEKSAGAEGRNLVSVRELRTASDRATELARMMSGGVTEKALARAHELLDAAV
ncbi:MAG TPA: DNA repair protein RecN [Candidatus Dormibacteraeota bacterium]